jgi:uncharacterized protein
MHQFKSLILNHPGLWNSGELHWQTQWEEKIGFERIIQEDWETPDCETWIDRLDEIVGQYDPQNLILTGHSLACSTIVFWAKKYNRRIKGALLVAPSDTEGPEYPDCTTGFKPMPLHLLPFPSIVVTSLDDVYVSPERARLFAQAWGSALIEVNGLGHINSTSNLGMWDFGLGLLAKLDNGVI